MALTKADVVDAVQTGVGFTRRQSIELVETLLETIKSKLASGEDVLVSGFGKFCVNEKRERRGRNSATGEDHMITARKVVTFRCSGNGYSLDIKGFDKSEIRDVISIY
jgi:integration host factor subunit alpha